MAGIKILACKLGKHDWKRLPVENNNLEMWVCSVCGEKKYHLDYADGIKQSDPGEQAGQTAQSEAAVPTASAEPLETTDELTGLLNKNGAIDYIENYLKKHKRDNFSLCMCDIDSLRTVNETWGNERGDLVLREVTAILKTELANMGIPCRWGGDEFLLLFPGHNGDEAYNKLFTLREKIKSRVIYYDGDGISVTMTFGLIEYDFYSKVNEFVAEAEEKLNLAKQMGRDQVVF